MFLASASLKPRSADKNFPFNLAVVKRLETVEFTQPLTIIVGENGSGKSTLLEALACASERVSAGSFDLSRDPSLAHARRLGGALRLSWTQKTRRGLFLRAEDFFGYIRAQNDMKAELQAELRELRLENSHLPEPELRRISGPYAGSLAATEARYGGDLDANSHGESFLAFFKARLSAPGLYILDEPEAALSPLSQLAFLSLLRQAAENGSQIILATHAPILMVFPGAQLLEVRDGQLTETDFGELAHVKLFRDFLTAPEVFLRHL